MATNISEMNRWEPNEKHSRTYANVERLNTALRTYQVDGVPIIEMRHTIYRFESGRVTALFIGISNQAVSFHKFPVVG